MKRPAPVASAVIGAIVAALSLSGCRPSGPTGFPNTALFAGLPDDYAAGTALLRRRLAARFPVGGAARGLVPYFAQQGMTIAPDRRSAEVRVNGTICGSMVRVQWAADRGDRLRDLVVLYSDTGCP